MSADQSKSSSEHGSWLGGREKVQIISMVCVILLLLVIMMGMPSYLNSNKKDSVGSRNLHDVFGQMLDYEWAFPPPTPLDPLPFSESADALTGITDCEAGAIVPLEAVAEEYLLHKARTRADSIVDEASDSSLQYEDMTTRPDEVRGMAVHATGKLISLTRRSRESAGGSRCDMVYEGLISDDSQQMYFFEVTDYPLNLYPRDIVEITGYFLKVHGDASLEIGPLLVAQSLSLKETPPFEEDETYLQKMVGDDDTDKISKIELPGWYYLLHKLRFQDSDILASTVDGTIALEHMIQQPRLVRGKAVEVRGVLLRVAERVPVAEKDNPSGIRHAYNGYIGTANGLYRFSLLEPPLFDRGDNVVLHGYFLQRVSHFDQQNIKIITPMIVGYNLMLYKMPPPDSNDMFLWFSGGIVLAILVMLYILMHIDNRISAKYIAEHRVRFRRKDVDLKASGARLIHDREESIRRQQENKKLREAKKSGTNVPEDADGGEPPTESNS